MIAVDTSALVAVAFGEPESESFKEILRNTDKARVSTVSVLDAHGRARATRAARGAPDRRTVAAAVV